jgi:thiol-disulfide isomerase/thioredoxin
MAVVHRSRGTMTSLSKLTALLLPIAVLLPNVALAAEAPALFTPGTLAEAKARAQREHKMLIVDFTASWCGPCHLMDQTSWQDAAVKDWVSSKAIAIQLDVDKEGRPDSKALGIYAMPTVVLFRPPKYDKEFDRHLGYIEPDRLLHWLQGAAAGKNEFQLLADDVKELKGKGGKKEVEARFKYAQAAADKEKFAETVEQYIWLWKNIPKQAHDLDSIRLSYIADDMARLIGKFPPARKSFEALRDEAKGNPDDWTTLNNALGDDKKTLEWFDQIKNDNEKINKLSVPTQHLVVRLLVQKGRWADAAKLFPDPLAYVKKMDELSQAVLKANPRVDLFPEEIAVMYGCLLAAGRAAEAKEVEQAALRVRDSEVMRRMLSAAATAAQQPHKTP